MIGILSRSHNRWLLAVVALCPATCVCAAPRASAIKDDEVVTLFATYARRVPDEDVWELRLHGWIYEPEDDSLLRDAALATLQRALGVAPEDAGAPVFQRRGRRFLVDNQRGKRVAVRLGERTHVLPASEPNGHFRGTLRLSAAEVNGLPRGEPDSGADPVRVRTAPARDGRVFEGVVHLIGPEGLSVISDIDDTVKVTEVTDKKKLVENTFLKEFVAAPGMAALYRRWAAHGASLHFVSSSPWQLYPELAPFLAKAGFPAATFHLKPFRVKDSTLLDLLKKGTETKPLQIEPILDAFPRRRFYLVGDSGEQDPEVYGAIAPRRPKQVLHVYIRNVTGETRDDERFRKAFSGWPEGRWTLFSDPTEVAR